MTVIFNEDICNGEAAFILGHKEAARKRRYKILDKAYRQEVIKYSDFSSLAENQCYNDCYYLSKKNLLCPLNKTNSRKDRKFAITNWGEYVLKKAFKAMFPTATFRKRDEYAS